MGLTSPAQLAMNRRFLWARFTGFQQKPAGFTRFLPGQMHERSFYWTKPVRGLGPVFSG